MYPISEILLQTTASAESSQQQNEPMVGTSRAVDTSSLASIDLQHGLDEATLQKFKQDGFVNLGQIFSQEDISDIKLAFDVTLALAGTDETNENGIEFIREEKAGPVRSMMAWEDFALLFKYFARDSQVLDAVKSIIGPNVVFHQTKYNPKAPSSEGKEWNPHRGMTFWHFLDGVPKPEKMVSVFIALTDQTLENGAVYTWRGAHKVGLDDLKNETDFKGRGNDDTDGDTAAYLSLQIKPEKIEEYNSRFEKVPLTGPAGTVWLLDSRNLHASPENTSDKVRGLVANVYRSVGNTPQHPRTKQYLCNTSEQPLRSYTRINSA